MLLEFSVENWMSYLNEADFSMIASRERQHSETLFRLPGWRSRRVLPTAAIYGGNASGKTAILKALSALRRMVVHDAGIDGLLPIESFKLSEPDKPTSLDITFLINDHVYRLYVELTAESIVYESLELVKQAGNEYLYEREWVSDEYEYHFKRGFFSKSPHVEYAAQSTRGNRLFLESAVAQNVIELTEPYLWFAQVLQLVGVGSHAWSFATAAGTQKGFLAFAESTLSRMDTGIVKLVGEHADLGAVPRDGSLRKRIAELRPDEVITIVVDVQSGDYAFDMLTVRLMNGSPDVQRLRTVHMGPDGKEHVLALGAESSGTQRLMGLLPMLYELVGPNGKTGSKVFVVDGLDRCLHTMLTRQLVDELLSGCGEKTRKQLIFTTHDLLLMDQSLMRRDEMYITQRSADGSSDLIPLSDYSGIRYDKDLIRSYLDGRFGGIPMFRQKDADE